VYNRSARKLRRRQHRAFDVNVRIHETGQEVPIRHIGRLLHLRDLSICDVDRGGANASFVEINELSGNRKTVGHVQGAEDVRRHAD